MKAKSEDIPVGLSSGQRRDDKRDDREGKKPISTKHENQLRDQVHLSSRREETVFLPRFVGETRNQEVPANRECACRQCRSHPPDAEKPPE